MPESYEHALTRAIKEGFTKDDLEKGEKGWYIIPHGITNLTARRAYVHCRDSGSKPSICAAVAHTLQNNSHKKARDKK